VTPPTPRLLRLARDAAGEREEALERCDLCGEPIPAEHRHLLDVSSRELLCACQACRLLFERPAAGGGGAHYRLVPDRRIRLDDFAMDEAVWARLRIPVEMAFFFHSSQAARVQAYYPGPMGATESLLELGAWEELERGNPLLGTLEPDVEALLVNRSRGARQYFVVPIEDCYRLAGLIRMRWRGLSGGEAVWKEIEAFFEKLGREARSSRLGREARSSRRGRLRREGHPRDGDPTEEDSKEPTTNEEVAEWQT
jgi:Family of unknown function (DUF5947)